MEVSKVTLTNEFKEKTRKPLGNVKRRELRLKMLAKSEADGSLSKAKNRYEVANLAGFTAKQKQSGYLWVYKQVKEGKIAEHIMNYLPNGKAEYEYHVIDTTSKPREDSIVDKGIQEAIKEFPQLIMPVEEPKKQTVILTNVHPKVTIKLSHIELVLEDMPLNDITALVHTLDKEA